MVAGRSGGTSSAGYDDAAKAFHAESSIGSGASTSVTSWAGGREPASTAVCGTEAGQASTATGAARTRSTTPGSSTSAASGGVCWGAAEALVGRAGAGVDACTRVGSGVPRRGGAPVTICAESSRAAPPRASASRTVTASRARAHSAAGPEAVANRVGGAYSGAPGWAGGLGGRGGSANPACVATDASAGGEAATAGGAGSTHDPVGAAAFSHSSSIASRSRSSAGRSGAAGVASEFREGRRLLPGRPVPRSGSGPNAIQWQVGLKVAKDAGHGHLLADRRHRVRTAGRPRQRGAAVARLPGQPGAGRRGWWRRNHRGAVDGGVEDDPDLLEHQLG